MNTILIGPRAVGKSTIGRLLAQRIDTPFIDLDDLVLARFAQSSIIEVWSAHGESAWRQAETASLPDALKSEKAVIALGGGAPLVPASGQMIEAARSGGAARVIYLQCSPAILAQRLKKQPGDRPSLTGAGIAEEIAAVAAGRHAAYQVMSDWECNTGESSPSVIVQQIIGRFFNLPHSPRSTAQPER